MNALSHLRSRPWIMLAVFIGLVAGHMILFYILRQAGTVYAGVSGVVVSAVVLIILAKHLGLFAALLRPLHTLFRRRSRSEKS